MDGITNGLKSDETNTPEHKIRNSTQRHL